MRRVCEDDESSIEDCSLKIAHFALWRPSEDSAQTQRRPGEDPAKAHRQVCVALRHLASRVNDDNAS
jgi:hypothetical protein